MNSKCKKKKESQESRHQQPAPVGGHADGLWNYKEIQPQGWALLWPKTSRSKKKNCGDRIVSSQPCKLVQATACHRSPRWLQGSFVPSWAMGAKLGYCPWASLQKVTQLPHSWTPGRPQAPGLAQPGQILQAPPNPLLTDRVLGQALTWMLQLRDCFGMSTAPDGQARHTGLET